MLKRAIVVLIKMYHGLVSPFLGSHCRFVPSCSLYAQDAIAQRGVVCGAWLVFKRLLRCHPWCQGGYDPVPPVAEKK